MFLLHVYHTVENIGEESKDFLIGFMMGLSKHSFMRCSQILFEYYEDGRPE